MEPSPIVKRRLGSGYPNISPKNSKFDFELGNSILEPSMANNDIHSKVYEMGVAITDIGRLIQSFALFLHKILASLITGGAGSAFYIAENDFSADIGFPVMEAMNTKVMGIIESTFVIPVG